MNYLLDTNHLSPLVTVGHPLRYKIELALAAGDSFAVVTVALSEMLFGIGSLPRAKQNLAEWQQFYPFFKIYSVDVKVAEAAASLRLLLQRRGYQLAIIDAIIAVVALQEELTLLTTDKDFRPVSGLLHENWLISP